MIAKPTPAPPELPAGADPLRYHALHLAVLSHGPVTVQGMDEKLLRRAEAFLRFLGGEPGSASDASALSATGGRPPEVQTG